MAKELAATAREQGALEEAQAFLAEGFEISSRLGLTEIAGDVVMAVAWLASTNGKARESAILFGAREQSYEREGFEILPTTSWYWTLRADLVTALGEAAFEALRIEGRLLDHDAAVRFARSCLEAPLDQRR